MFFTIRSIHGTLFTIINNALIKEIDKNLKYKTIKSFTSERVELHRFLLQFQLNIKFNNNQF